jgi:hypothetical protein
MKEQLKYWRDLSKQEKRQLMQQHGIKAITFEHICMIYEERNKII